MHTDTLSERTNRTTQQRRTQRCNTCYGVGEVRRAVTDRHGQLIYETKPGNLICIQQEGVPCACIAGRVNPGYKPLFTVQAKGKHGARGRTPKGTLSKPRRRKEKTS